MAEIKDSNTNMTEVKDEAMAEVKDDTMTEVKEGNITDVKEENNKTEEPLSTINLVSAYWKCLRFKLVASSYQSSHGSFMIYFAP